MRVLLDTNLFISHLLAPDKEGTIQLLVEAAILGTYTLLIPSELIQELKEKLTTKIYLRQRIPLEAAQNFINAILTVAEQLSPITQSIPAVGRDLKDDYLLAYAVVGEADYLVTGDQDLQVLKRIQNVKILSPSGFLHILQE